MKGVIYLSIYPQTYGHAKHQLFAYTNRNSDLSVSIVNANGQLGRPFKALGVNLSLYRDQLKSGLYMVKVIH